MSNGKKAHENKAGDGSDGTSNNDMANDDENQKQPAKEKKDVASKILGKQPRHLTVSLDCDESVSATRHVQKKEG